VDFYSRRFFPMNFAVGGTVSSVAAAFVLLL